MSAFRCPRCPSALQFERQDGLRWWSCPEGHGRALTVAVARQRMAAERFRLVWGHIQAERADVGVPCPSCGRKMAESDHPTATGSLVLDHCRSCQILWFDTGEEGSVGVALDEPWLRDAAESAARAASTATEAAVIRYTTDDDSEGPPNADSAALWGAFFGFPIAAGAPARRNFPFVTYAVGGCMVLGLIWTMFHDTTAWDHAGYYADDPLFQGGRSALLSLVIDPRLLPAVFNTGIWFRFGDTVEDVLGHIGFAGVLVVAVAVGWGVHALTWAQPNVPMYGCSAVSMAIFSYYALRFPSVRLWFTYRSRSGYSGWRKHEEGETRWRSVGIGWAVLWMTIVQLGYCYVGSETLRPPTWTEIPTGIVIGAIVWAIAGWERMPTIDASGMDRLSSKR